MIRGTTRVLLAIALLAGGAASAHPRLAQKSRLQQPAARVALAPCRLSGWTRDVMCGSLEVPENRRLKDGRRITLKIVVVPATSGHALPDPVFYFAGGPGASAVETLTRVGASYLADLGRDRDLVFVDQRGTGESNPLPCAMMPDRNDMAAFFGDLVPVDKYRECKEALEKVADLTCYTTTIAMQDLDEVRAGLGYERINLYGGSYGSFAALAYMRQFPKRVRTATLLGVAPTDSRLPLPFARGVANAIDKLVEDCNASESCRADFPSVKADLDATLAQLDKGPVTFDTANPFTGKPYTVTITRAGFVEHLRLMLYQHESMKWLPILLHETAEGNFAVFGTVSFQIFRSVDDRIARGMQMSVLLSEDIPFITDADMVREMAGTIYGTKRLETYRKIGEFWPHVVVPASFVRPVVSDAPVLMISGSADPVAPPWLATAALKYLKNGRQIIVPHNGHVIVSPEMDKTIAAFVAAGSARDLDVSWVDNMKPAEFVTEAMLRAMAERAMKSRAPEGATYDESWQGTLDVGSAKLRLILKIARRQDAPLAAAIDSLDQGANDLRVDTITWANGKVAFTMNSIGARYEGTVTPDGNAVEGTWSQGTKSWPLRFGRLGKR